MQIISHEVGDIMAYTQSISFPNMFDVARNRVSILEDATSVANRSKLLILTEPTELYNSLDFGVGLKRHLFKYNTDNEKAIIKDRIVAQLRKYEPSVIADETKFADGLLFTGDPDSSVQDINKLKMTISETCKFGGTLEVEINNG